MWNSKRLVLAHFWFAFAGFGGALLLGAWQMLVRSPLHPWIRERVAERFPDDAILGEEQGLAGDADRVWIIDPIDGTKNFAAGIQIWGTLIALAVDGDPVVGVADG